LVAFGRNGTEFHVFLKTTWLIVITRGGVETGVFATVKLLMEKNVGSEIHGSRTSAESLKETRRNFFLYARNGIELIDLPIIKQRKRNLRKHS